jgi:hypothetical protein
MKETMALRRMANLHAEPPPPPKRRLTRAVRRLRDAVRRLLKAQPG